MNKKDILSGLSLLPSCIISICIAGYWGTHPGLSQMALFLKFWYLWTVMFINISISLWFTLKD